MGLGALVSKPTTLPPADWTRDPGLLSLVEAIGADAVRWVGGAVRDTLAGLPVKDVDAATPLLPDAIMERCAAAGIRTVPTGIEHGTVTAILPGHTVEVTTLRRDVATDGRRATVAYSGDWQEDAARRDFTINALYAHPLDLRISDYFGGLADLAAQKVRFIGDARERIAEDHLRILRYFRFRARFGGWARSDTETERAVADMACTLKGLSRERIAMELLAILALPNPTETVAEMARLGVLAVILPEARTPERGALRRLIVAEQTAGVSPDPIRRLAALLPPVAAVAETVAARLRLSNRQRLHLSRTAERSPADGNAPHALAYRLGREIACDRLLLNGQRLDALTAWEIPLFPFKGRDVIAAGVAPGPAVAQTLRKVEDAWIAAGFPAVDQARALLMTEVKRAQDTANRRDA